MAAAQSNTAPQHEDNKKQDTVSVELDRKEK